MRTVYAVGDVHGCPGMLDAVLASVLADADGRDDARPRLVILGDLIDRGPDSRAVVETLLSPSFRVAFEATVLRGNHEDMMNEALAHPRDAVAWMRHGGAETIESYGVEFGGDPPEKVMARFRKALPRSHREFIGSLPFSCREGELFLAHAGVNPRRRLDDQSPMDLMWIGLPFLRHRGDYGARVVHGHVPGDRVGVTPHRISVDTGCGYPRGVLSAAAVRPDGSVDVLSAGPAPAGTLDLSREAPRTPT